MNEAPAAGRERGEKKIKQRPGDERPPGAHLAHVEEANRAGLAPSPRARSAIDGQV
jgi:hypothetical protein